MAGSVGMRKAMLVDHDLLFRPSSTADTVAVMVCDKGWQN